MGSKRGGINVLSLFDGYAGARVALKRARISVKNYYASEVDKYAIQISSKNYPDIKHLGDVTKWGAWKLPKIDLLIGGSPCQGFSIAGKQLNFEDERSKLFFEYVKILNAVKPKYFLLENVKMKKESRDVISELLGVEPIEINSALVSAQNRPRLYWTNIKIGQPKDQSVLLKDIIFNTAFDKNPYIEKYVSNRPVNSNSKKFNTLRASAGSRTQGRGVGNNKGYWRKLTPIECERLQTLPDNYTSGVSNTQRYKMIGNGFTVDVITHILRGIKKEL